MKNKIKKIIINLSKKNLLFRKIFRLLLRIYKRIKYLRYYLFTKIDNKLVLFEVFNGRNYSDSPKTLYLEMLNNSLYKDYKFVWAFKDIDKDINIDKKRTKIVKIDSSEYFRYYAKAKYWFVNSRLNEAIIKKKNQIYIQCWHGTPLKRLGFDILKEGGNALNTKKEIKFKYESDAKNYSYMLSPSKFCTEKFTSAFNLKKLGKENIIIEKGYPRNDFLFRYTDKDVENVKKKLNIKNNKKIILYAPTWRDNQHTSGVGYTYKLGIDFDKLKKELEKDYIILFRAHYFVANTFDFEKYKGFVYDASKVEDVNDLYIISDILITDYSSVFFDYANLHRPILFYMYDKEEYQNKLRDFYFSLDELPGPIVEYEDDLINEIKKINNYDKKYKDKYIKFNNKFNYLDKKDTSKDVLEEIINNE